MSSTSIRSVGVTPWTQPFLSVPNYVVTSTLGSTGIVFTPPTGANLLRISANLDSYAFYGSSAVDTAAHSTGLGSEFIPYGTEVFRQITPGTTMISMASTAAAFCSISWWTL